MFCANMRKTTLDDARFAASAARCSPSEQSRLRPRPRLWPRLRRRSTRSLPLPAPRPTGEQADQADPGHRGRPAGPGRHRLRLDTLRAPGRRQGGPRHNLRVLGRRVQGGGRRSLNCTLLLSLDGEGSGQAFLIADGVNITGSGMAATRRRTASPSLAHDRRIQRDFPRLSGKQKRGIP